MSIAQILLKVFLLSPFSVLSHPSPSSNPLSPLRSILVSSICGMNLINTPTSRERVKKALVIGIMYKGSVLGALCTPHQDARAWVEFLKGVYHRGVDTSGSSYRARFSTLQ